jgi:hypothetical protein
MIIVEEGIEEAIEILKSARQRSARQNPPTTSPRPMSRLSSLHSIAGRAVPRHDAAKAASDKLHPHHAFAQDEHALRTTSTFWLGEPVIRAIGPLRRLLA